ncbi:hypothetical protein ZWY2020_042176 [Hordeum vulgare]|nr:hypothetical protein ZWY2020_042176 [Hordeum vulgare]
MAASMHAGLAVDGAGELKMTPSYVYSLPTGSETGLFYALDLGATNFRVLRVQVGGKDRRVVDTESKQVSIPKQIMHGTTEELFHFIASFWIIYGKMHIATTNFMWILNSVFCLCSTLLRVNDTVGALAGAHYWDEDVMVAVILGTGTNALYKMQIINTEWGAFSDGLPLTEFDRDMDAESINPGEQIFEKTISGMYLGEIVRRVLAKMAQESDLFGHSFSDKLAEPFVPRQLNCYHNYKTPHLCAMQQDNPDHLGEVESILRDIIGVNQSSLAARRFILEVSDCVIKRGRRLAGASIADTLQKMENDSKGLFLGRITTVVMDGGLYENYPQCRSYMVEAMAELLGPRDMEHIVVEHTKDGSGIGATLLAAANSKYIGAQLST